MNSRVKEVLRPGGSAAQGRPAESQIPDWEPADPPQMLLGWRPKFGVFSEVASVLQTMADFAILVEASRDHLHIQPNPAGEKGQRLETPDGVLEVRLEPPI